MKSLSAALNSLIYYINEEPLIDSIELANSFDINHKDIIKSIKDSTTPEDFSIVEGFLKDGTAAPCCHITIRGAEWLLNKLKKIS